MASPATKNGETSYAYQIRSKKATCFDELTEQEKQFILIYISNGFNATDAYDITHPNSNAKKTYASNAYKYRKRLQPFIEEKMKDKLDALNVTAEHVLMELAEIGFAPKGDPEYCATIKLKALDLIQKQLGLQSKTTNLNAEVTGAVTIIDDYGTTDKNK